VYEVKSYCTELDLNDRQRTACLRHAGAARFAYNWGLLRKREAYEATGKSPSAIDLHRELNALKKTELPWMYEVSKCAPQEALRNLDKAFEGFFLRCKQGASKKGFPKFKSRKRGIGSFSFTGVIHVTERTIQLPRVGVVRLKERGYFPTEAKITRATVSERAGRWFVSILTDEDPVRVKGTEVLGVDVGIVHLATLSDGTVFENPRALKVAQKRLKRLQRAVSRKQKGSRNRKKAVQRLARQHYRVACVRSNAIHQATNAIAKRACVVGIETLNVRGMLRNHCLAGALSDAGLSEFLRQLEYKVQWAGGTVVKADRWYPSSKTCSSCGSVNEGLTLAVREWACVACGSVHDRDVNAAINLENMAVSSAVTACGEERAGAESIRVKRSSTKQEPNTEQGMSLFGSVWENGSCSTSGRRSCSRCCGRGSWCRSSICRSWHCGRRSG
jgi:putative transposase